MKTDKKYDVRVMKNSEPLKNEMLRVNVLCLICFIFLSTVVIIFPIKSEYTMLCVTGLLLILLGMGYIYAHVMENKSEKIRNISK